MADEKLENDKKQIERLLKKSDIKEANGMNCSEELTEVLKLIAMHPAPMEEVDAYRNWYTTLALSLLKEPLSDIPMGRVTQFTKILNAEYNAFREECKGKKRPVCICNQFDRLEAVSEYLDYVIMDLSDKEEFVETPELNNIEMELVNAEPNCEASVYIDTIEKTLDYYDAVIKLLNKGVETNDIALMSVTIFYLATTNLYLHYSIEYMREENKKAPV